MYGKIIGRKFVPAPNPMVIDGYKVYNPDPEQYEAEEFLEVVEAEYPMESGKHYEKKYSAREGKILAEWVEVEAPVREPALDERILAVEAQMTDTQLALCELYEALCAADVEEA